MEPELEQMSPDEGEGAGVFLGLLQVLLYNPPAGWLLSREEGWVEQVALWEGRRGRRWVGVCVCSLYLQ